MEEQDALEPIKMPTEPTPEEIEAQKEIARLEKEKRDEYWAQLRK